MFFVYINVIMNCGCKSKAFYLHIIYKHDIPLKLTIAKGMILSRSDSSYISNKLLRVFLFIV